MRSPNFHRRRCQRLFEHPRHPRPPDGNHFVTDLVADHLLGKGLRDLGFVGLTGNGFSECRRAIFRRRVEAAGATYHEFIGEQLTRPPVQRSAIPPRLRWPPPLQARRPLRLPRRPRTPPARTVQTRPAMRVPDEVAVVGVDNDMLHVAAANLCCRRHRRRHRLRGRPHPRPARRQPRPRTAPHHRHQTHRPDRPPISDIIAISDTAISTAIRHIRQHVHEGFTGIQHHRRDRSFAPLAGTALPRRHRPLPQRRNPPHAQLDRQQLLATTTISMAAIADQTGFSSARQFGATFLAQIGQTPTAYRKQFSAVAVGQWCRRPRRLAVRSIAAFQLSPIRRIMRPAKISHAAAIAALALALAPCARAADKSQPAADPVVEPATLRCLCLLDHHRRHNQQHRHGLPKNRHHRLAPPRPLSSASKKRQQR